MYSFLNVVGTQTVLLLHFDQSFVDASGRHAVVPYGNARIDTTQSKFGGASVFFDNGLLGTGSYLRVIGNSDDFAFGTDDFSIDFWGMIRAANHVGFAWDLRASPSDIAPAFNLSFPGTLQAYYVIDGNDAIAGTSAPSVNVWHHYAVAQAGGITRMFIDGVQNGPDYEGEDNMIFGNFSIGTHTLDGTSRSWDGWIDELRVVRGSAVWTSNFTPPTSAYTP